MDASDLQAARQSLAAVNQQHVLHFHDQLDASGKRQLVEQINGIDWPEVARLIETHVKHKPTFTLPDNIAPAPWYPYQPGDDAKQKYEKAREIGWNLVKQGKVAAFTVAGGQGTRLGWDAPKGTFPATAVRKQSLFGCMADYLINCQQRCGCVIPWYIMTSPINDQPTRDFFREHDYYGLDPANVMLFPQAMMPAIDMHTGKVLLAAPDSLALSPNGHGGSLKALWHSGAIDDMKKRGIEQISYTQVDNPIVRIIDPLFLGLHVMDKAQMSSKMLPKREPLEKLGNFCLVNGKMTVIEYSNLPDELAHETLDDGELRFRAGSIAIHVIRMDFVESLNTRPGGFALPFNRAEKKVPHVTVPEGKPVDPTTPNAIKLETFVFDALPFCESSIVYETDRGDEFAPVKNADGPGANDCPATSIQIQSNRSGLWLEQQGVKIPRRADGSVDAVIDLSQRTAIYPQDLEGKKLPAAVASGEILSL